MNKKQGSVVSARCGSLRGARLAVAVAALLGAALLLLCAAPLPRPPGLADSPASSLAEWMSDEDDEPLPAGIVRVRERFVPGHTRAHAELCAARGAGTRLVVLVASAPAHAQRRLGIRRTWGQAARRADVAFGFVLGAPPPDQRAELDAEDALYGDLIMGRYVDSFANITLKTLSMLEWFVGYCPRAERLLRADDDVFVNIEGLLRFAEAPERRGANRTIWGNLWPNSLPYRTTKSKYFVPPEEFPGNSYPPFVSSGAFVMSGDAAGTLLRATLRARWLRADDVLVTGVAAAAAGVRRERSPPFILDRRKLTPCVLRAALAVHKVPFLKQFDLWRDLHNSADSCPSKS